MRWFEWRMRRREKWGRGMWLPSGMVAGVGSPEVEGSPSPGCLGREDGGRER